MPEVKLPDEWSAWYTAKILHRDGGVVFLDHHDTYQPAVDQAIDYMLTEYGRNLEHVYFVIEKQYHRLEN